ncbi:MAG: response regulator [Planctomycetes bacterium]|nr:response regulator [Planctomycetota bacterium]
MLQWTAFAVGLLAAGLAREGDGTWLQQAVVWLPSGIAVFGVWRLGWRALLVVGAVGAVLRVGIGYPTGIVVAGSIGSVLEAWFGARLLRRLGVSMAFARMRDVLALCAVATLAPGASVLASWVGRVAFDVFRDVPFYSGWGGWWRMNALGLLLVLPLLGTWRSVWPLRPTRRGVATAVLLGVLLAAVVWAVFFELAPSAITGLMLHSTMLLALVAALRFGTCGAATVAALAAIALNVATAHGLGPFALLDAGSRHSVLQLFELSLLAVPVAFGALIAEREGALASRLRSERRLSALTEVLPDVTWRLRADGTCLAMMVPPGVVPVVPPEQAVGARLDTLLPAAAAAAWLDRVRATLRGERVEPFEHELRVADRPRVYELRCVRLSPHEALCLQRDITDRRALEDELRRAQKLEAVGRLAGGVAHDFNNVLTVVVGCAENQIVELPPGTARDDARLIVESAERAARLTRQLLAFSRQQVLAPAAVDVGAVVDDLAALLRRTIGEHVELELDRGERPATALVDRGQLEQVVTNLVLNARDAMPRGGRVRITSRTVVLDAGFTAQHGTAAGRYVRLAVGDNGVGMDAATCARAFEPFFTTKPQGRGTGLGLATVWGIARQSGGFVTIDSAPEVGTTVAVYLPAANGAEATFVLPTAPPRRASAATILVAEDDPAVRERLVSALQKGGHTVLAAADGEAALRLVAAVSKPIDLLVTDVVMPRCDGRQLADQLRRSRAGLRVLFVSGYPDHRLDGDGGLPPATGFLAKPFTREDLLGQVDALLATAT